MLTKESKTVLYHLYKEYRFRRKNGQSRSASKSFGSSERVQSSFFPDWTISDVDDCMRELKRKGFLHTMIASNLVYESELTDDAIAIMDNQKKDTFVNITNFLLKFIP